MVVKFGLGGSGVDAAPAVLVFFPLVTVVKAGSVTGAVGGVVVAGEAAVAGVAEDVKVKGGGLAVVGAAVLTGLLFVWWTGQYGSKLLIALRTRVSSF